MGTVIRDCMCNGKVPMYTLWKSRYIYVIVQNIDFKNKHDLAHYPVERDWLKSISSARDFCVNSAVL